MKKLILLFTAILLLNGCDKKDLPESLQALGSFIIDGELDFLDILIGESVTSEIFITNDSDNPIEIFSISLPNNAFQVNWSNGILAAGSTQSISVTFEPTEVESYSGTLTIENDTFTENNSIDIVANGVISESNGLAVEIISGNNLIGVRGRKLVEPIRVRLTENSIPVNFRGVRFEILSGDGNVQYQHVYTDDDGFAETFWYLGDFLLEQSVKAYYEDVNVVFNSTNGVIGNWIYGTSGSECSDIPYRFVFNSDNTITFNNESEGWNQYLTDSNYTVVNHELRSLNFTLSNIPYGGPGCSYTKEVSVTNLEWVLLIGQAYYNYKGVLSFSHSYEGGCNTWDDCSGGEINIVHYD